MAGILCLKSGPVIGHIWAEKRGYVPANNIPFRVKLENKSSRKISAVHVTLSQVEYTGPTVACLKYPKVVKFSC